MDSQQVMTRGTAERSAVRLYRRWIDELWTGQQVAAELVSDDFVGHWPNRDVHGPAELQSMVDETRAMFRELEFYVDVDPFAVVPAVRRHLDRDMLAARWIGTGARERGPVLFAGNDILRVRDGRIVEYWACTSS